MAMVKSKTNRDMDKERMEYLEKQLSSIRKTAVRLEAAIQAKKQEQERAGLLERKNFRKEIEKNQKTEEEIIESGTPEERASLYLSDIEMRLYGFKRRLTKEQIKKLSTFEKKEDKEAFVGYLTLFDGLEKYTQKLAYVFKMYQLSISSLATLLKKWDWYEYIIPMIEIAYFSLKNTGGKTGMRYNFTNNNEEEMKSLDATTPEELLAEWNASNSDGDVIYRADGNKIIADIFQDGGLYSKIQEEAKDAEETLSQLKAYIQVIENFLLENGYYFFMPQRMDMIMNNVMQELFARSIIDKKYFRSELNAKKIDRGEPVTEQEELLAVVPDYYEIKADKDEVRKCKHGIEILFT